MESACEEEESSGASSSKRMRWDPSMRCMRRGEEERDADLEAAIGGGDLERGKAVVEAGAAGEGAVLSPRSFFFWFEEKKEGNIS